MVSAGYGSRRTCASIIMKGSVKSNGHFVTSLKHLISPTDEIEVNGSSVQKAQSKKVYLLLHKPKGYLSSVSDDRSRPTVLDLIPKNYKTPGLVPAGRLDYLSSGLMIITNDGDLVYKITHPKFKIEKEVLFHVNFLFQFLSCVHCAALPLLQLVLWILQLLMLLEIYQSTRIVNFFVA